MKKETVNIELEDWDYECGDHCCTDYGVRLKVNGVECDNDYAGDNVEQALTFVLEQLGYKVNMINRQNYGTNKRGILKNTP